MNDMFATTNAMDMTMDQNRKRSREDPGFGPTSSSFAEHRSKRVQCLPLRTASTTLPEQWPPAAPTRINGVQPDESVPRSHAESWPSIATHDSSLHDAMDDEMDMTGIDANSAGRTPTPIQPNFSSNLRGPNQHWAEQAGRQGIVNMGHQQTGLAPPMEIKSGTSWQIMHQNHSLPSPISETENGVLETPQVTVEPCHTHSAAYPEMQHSNAVMDIERLPVPEDNADAPSPSPPRKGHSRSVHTVNSWTWQPGMKKSFSIGFRSDCEKCRDKVPGHFNHIVIS